MPQCGGSVGQNFKDTIRFKFLVGDKIILMKYVSQRWREGGYLLLATAGPKKCRRVFCNSLHLVQKEASLMRGEDYTYLGAEGLMFINYC